jgi:hypothetical protein
MPDYLNKLLDKAPAAIKAAFDHNRYLAIAMLICGTLAGCALIQPKATSPTTGKPVTRDQLDAEVTAFAATQEVKIATVEAEAKAFEAKAKTSYAEIERKEETIRQVLTTVSGLVESVPGPWTGLAASGLTLLTMGLGLDNWRKDAVISKSKTGAK